MDDSHDEKADMAVVAAASVFAEAVQEKDWPLALLASFKLGELLDLVNEKLVAELALPALQGENPDSVVDSVMGRLSDWLDRFERTVKL